MVYQSAYGTVDHRPIKKIPFFISVAKSFFLLVCDWTSMSRGREKEEGVLIGKLSEND